jgi:glutamine amidotransferase
MPIDILNYGLGNINSIANMLRKLAIEYRVICTPEEVRASEKIIIPGVGSFDHGMAGLQNAGIVQSLNEVVCFRKIPILGICLGMQLLCNKSDEGVLPGLGWIDADVKRFSFPTNPSLKIPHMGWNTVEVSKKNNLISYKSTETRYYFVHSYHVVCKNQENILATTEYGFKITAALNFKNIYGVQFHPEKSHIFGMELLKNFAKV